MIPEAALEGPSRLDRADGRGCFLVERHQPLTPRLSSRDVQSRCSVGVRVSSADFDDEYLNEQGPPYVRLQKDGDRIAGEYHIGLQNGSLDGRPQPGGSILLRFEGMDETTRSTAPELPR